MGILTLKEACELVLSKHPGKRISLVNEYDKVYQFVLTNKNERRIDMTIICHTPCVIKNTGVLMDDELANSSYFKSKIIHRYDFDE